MLRALEVFFRRRWPTMAAVGGMSAALVAMGGGLAFAVLWAVPAALAALMIRENRAWMYLRLGNDRLALEAAREQITEAEGGERSHYHRLAAAAALLGLRQTDQAKAVLAEVDPNAIRESARPGYFLLMGALFARLGDLQGVLCMADAAGAGLMPGERSPSLHAAVENLHAVGLLLRGDLEAASDKLGAIPLDHVGTPTRAVILNNRAWAELRRGGDPLRALDWAREALRGMPKEAAIHGTFGAALLEAGADAAQASAHLDRAVRVVDRIAPQERAHVLFYAARARRLLGDGSGAGRLVERMHELPGSEELLGRLALPAPEPC